MLALVQFVAKLKSVPRTGWLDRGIEPLQVESVADHSFGMALLAWACALQRRAEGAAIDPERVLKLAIMHDLAEAAWHHPDLTASYAWVEVRLMSHDAKGVTDRDFQLAKKIEEVVHWQPGLEDAALEGTPQDDMRFSYIKYDNPKA